MKYVFFGETYVRRSVMNTMYNNIMTINIFSLFCRRIFKSVKILGTTKIIELSNNDSIH